MAAMSDLLKDSPLGYFWLPGQHERQVPGAIVERDGVLQLELIELLAEASDCSSTKGSAFYPVIHGWLSKGGAVSLYNCVSGNNESIPGNEWETCSFAYAIKQRQENAEDLHSDEASVDLLRLANVQLGGLAEWTRLNGLQEQWHTDATAQGGRRWTASYVLPEPRVYRVDSGLTVKLLATCHFSNVGFLGLQLLQDVTLEVSFDEAMPFAELESKVHSIRLLLMLLSGLELRPTWNHVGRVSDAEALPVFRNHMPRLSAEPAHLQLRTLVPFEDISAELPELFSKWDGVQSAYGDAVATSLFTPYLAHTNETKISNLVNSLVRYAEADAEKKVLVETVLDKTVRLYLPTASNEVVSALKERIEATRHYYTHFNPSKKEMAAEGAALANVVDFLDVINRCVLLEKLGLDRDRVLQWVHKSREYGKRFRMERFKEFEA
jgi:hypothetical protein